MPDTPERPKRGRPRVSDEPLSALTTHIPVRDHDRLIALAKRHEQSVSSIVREVIQTVLERRSRP